MSELMNNVFGTVHQLILYGFIFMVLMLVVEDMPLKSYLVNPVIAVVQRNPTLIGIMLIGAAVLLLINNILLLYKLCSDIKNGR